MAASSSSSSFHLTSPALLLHPLSSPTTRLLADDLACTWILEFIFRQPIPDSVAHEIFLCLPFSSADLHPHLRKTLLIRRILSDLHRRSLSERTLHSLELIAELDLHRGVSPSNRLKAAYCSAAVECAAVAYRRSRDDFLEVVRRIWMPEADGDLVSDPLVDWGKKMEQFISSGEGGEDILKRDASNALNLVRDYLEEALEEMGPSFLEIAAAEIVNKKDINVTGIAGKGIAENLARFEILGETEDGMDDLGCSVSTETMDDTPARDLERESNCLGDASKNHDDQFYGTVGSEFHHLELEVESRPNDGRHDMPDHRRCKIHQFDSSEVCKAKDALRRSCFILNEMVDDPLPEAQAVAASVMASMSLGHGSINEQAKQISEENSVLPVPPVQLVNGAHIEVDAGILDFEKDKSNSVSDLQQMEDRILKDSNEDKSGKNNIFERNSTAHTLEWSESSLESPVSMEKTHSSNCMKRRTSPIRLVKRMLAKRRAVKRWTPLEEHALRDAVTKYGKGNWKLILNCNSDVFEERTEIDLKDKWRNLARRLS